MQAEFRTLLGLRYGAQDIIRLLGKDAMLIGPETARHSSFVKPLMVEERKRGLEKGLAKGREEGREEGRVMAMRDWIQRTLTRRFPRSTFPDLHAITSIETLQDLADIAPTGSASKIATAIRRASNGNHSA
jgi:predicted transposase YdaD